MGIFLRCVAVVCLTALLGLGAENQAGPKKLWWASVAAVAAGSAMDVQSSWGRPELNPVLRGPDGRFGARGMSIKLGLTGTATLVQWLILRKQPRASKGLAVVNFVAGGALAGSAARNYSLR